MMDLQRTSRCEISRSPSYRALPATSPVHARPVEPRTFQFDSRGCPVRRHLRPRAEKAGHISSNRLLQLAEVKRLPRAKNEIWYQRIPDPQQRPEGDQGSYGGCLKRARARLSPSVILNLVCLAGAGHGRSSRPVRSRRTQVTPSLPAGGGARPGGSIDGPGG